MQPKELVPELIVDDVSRSIQFYKDMLGFEVSQQAPEKGAPTWAEIVNGPARFMLQNWKETLNEMPRLSERPRGGITIFVLRLDTQDKVREIAKSLSNRTNVVLPLRETDYGTVEFGITDPDGYVILFSAGT